MTHAGCDRAVPLDNVPPRAHAHPGYVVDTVQGTDEALARFLAGIHEVPTELAGGAGSREVLVRRFFDAVVNRDSIGLRAMHLDRAEFGALYYPASAFAASPYELPPGVLWFRVTAESNKGLSRAMRLLSEPAIRYRGHECNDEPEIRGGNLLWTGCTVSWTGPGGDPATFRLFGSVIERDSHFKFVSFANRL